MRKAREDRTAEMAPGTGADGRAGAGGSGSYGWGGPIWESHAWRGPAWQGRSGERKAAPGRRRQPRCWFSVGYDGWARCPAAMDTVRSGIHGREWPSCSSS